MKIVAALACGENIEGRYLFFWLNWCRYAARMEVYFCLDERFCSMEFLWQVWPTLHKLIKNNGSSPTFGFLVVIDINDLTAAKQQKNIRKRGPVDEFPALKGTLLNVGEAEWPGMFKDAL
ncbi:MAG: hypothetical protein ACOYXA_12585 [Bacteroidota bacterium]